MNSETNHLSQRTRREKEWKNKESSDREWHILVQSASWRYISFTDSIKSDPLVILVIPVSPNVLLFMWFALYFFQINFLRVTWENIANSCHTDTNSSWLEKLELAYTPREASEVEKEWGRGSNWKPCWHVAVSGTLWRVSACGMVTNKSTWPVITWWAFQKLCHHWKSPSKSLYLKCQVINSSGKWKPFFFLLDHQFSTMVWILMF